MGKKRKNGSHLREIEFTAKVNLAQLYHGLASSGMTDYAEILDCPVKTSTSSDNGKKRKRRTNQKVRMIHVRLNEEEGKNFDKLRKLADAANNSDLIRHALFDVYQDFLEAMADGAKFFVLRDGEFMAIEHLREGQTSIPRRLI